MCGSVRLVLVAGALLAGPLLLDHGAASAAEHASAAGFETVRTSNAALLNRLGMSPLRFPDGHHKKRLAGPEPPANPQTRIHQQYGRRHEHRDSHVYIVKLPPNPPYYTVTKPHKTAKGDKDAKNALGGAPAGFRGNGKPARVYHWNLPVVKKMAEKKRILALGRTNQGGKKADEESGEHQRANSVSAAHRYFPKKALPSTDDSREQYRLGLRSNGVDRDAVGKGANDKKRTPEKQSRNNDKRLHYPEILEGIDKSSGLDFPGRRNNTGKTYRLEDSLLFHLNPRQNDRGDGGGNSSNELHDSRNTAGGQKPKKHRKKAATSYYAPIASRAGSTSVHKNFPGNGKPKAFYVIEKSRKPVYYHPLLP